MKSAIKNLSIPILALTLSITGCKKYDEGPNISLRSKTERISNAWKVAKAIANDGNDVTDSYDKYDLEMLKNGDAKLAVKYIITDMAYKFETEGSWSFRDKKKELVLDMENLNGDRTYKILKLKEDELWLRDDDSRVELHLEPK